MTLDEVKQSLDVLAGWTPPQGIYYVLGYAPFSDGKLVISFGLSPHFGDTGETWDVEIGRVPSLDTLQKIEAALVGKLLILPFLATVRPGPSEETEEAIASVFDSAEAVRPDDPSIDRGY